MYSSSKQRVTSGCTGQISAVTFFAKTRKKAAIKNLLGEPGVKFESAMIPRILSTLVLLFSSSITKAESPLLGTWKSSLEISLARNELESLAPNTLSFIRQVVGEMTIAYEADVLIENSPNKTLTIEGKEYEWTGANGRFPYKVLKHLENSVLIKRKLADGSWAKGIITFENPDLYRINWQDHSDVDFDEYFVRQ
jgi:hypothetical protein